MTLSEIKTLLVSADATIKHYFSKSTGSAYSYWEETRMLPTVSDGEHDEHWMFYVHRFTKEENDATAAAIFAKLDGDPRVSVKWIHGGYEHDTGYLHHIFECEG